MPQFDINFFMFDGETFTVNTKTTGDKDRFRVGDRLSVEYDPMKPDRSRLTVDIDRDNSGLLSVAAIGVVCFAIGAASMTTAFFVV